MTIEKNLAVTEDFQNAVCRVGGKNLLLALFDIAYRSRLGLPLIVSAGLMFFDIQARYTYFYHSLPLF